MEGEDVDYHQDLKSSDSEGEPVSFPYCMEWSQHQHVVMEPCFHTFRNFTHHFVFTIKRKVPYVTFHSCVVGLWTRLNYIILTTSTGYLGRSGTRVKMLTAYLTISLAQLPLLRIVLRTWLTVTLTSAVNCDQFIVAPSYPVSIFTLFEKIQQKSILVCIRDTTWWKKKKVLKYKTVYHDAESIACVHACLLSIAWVNWIPATVALSSAPGQQHTAPEKCC